MPAHAETSVADRLFQPNNHSVSTVTWKPVSPDTFLMISRTAHDLYGFTEVHSVEQVEEWERMSNNFRVRGVVGGEEVVLIIRKHILISDPARVEQLADILSRLHRAGVAVPQVVRTVDGSVVGKGVALFEAFDYIPGDHYHGTLRQLVEVGKGIAKMHVAMRELPAFAVPASGSGILPPWERTTLGSIHARAVSGGWEIDERFLSAWDRIDAAMRRAESQPAPVLPLQPIHCDLHPLNTIFDGDTLRAILDFDTIRPGARARDVANACHRFVRQFVVASGQPWEETLPEGIRIFLSAYESVEPLTSDERAAMPVLLVDELLRKIQYICTEAYDNGNDRLMTPENFDKLVGLLEEADVIVPHLLAS